MKNVNRHAMQIRKATKNDVDQIWDIFKTVMKTGDTYTFPVDTPKKDLDKYWLADYMTTFVAEQDGKIIGTYIIKPNQIGLGSHIANCGYMVHPNEHGKGIGQELCAHSIDFAKKQSYLGIQFNIVVSTNHAAIHLWKKFGFKIIGTTPKGFKHANLGLVDTHIMYLAL